MTEACRTAIKFKQPYSTEYIFIKIIYFIVKLVSKIQRRIFLFPTEDEGPICFAVKNLFPDNNLKKKKSPSCCSILIYSLSNSSEENFNLSVIYLIIFF